MELVYISIAITFIIGLVGFLMKTALADRDKRFDYIDTELMLIQTAIRDLQTQAAVCNNRHNNTEQDIKELLRATERVAERIERL